MRRGSDIVKARALGAKGVLVGRAALWGISAAGQAGAEHALGLLRREYEKTLAYVGCRNAAALSADVLASDQSLSGHRCSISPISSGDVAERRDRVSVDCAS